ncbi:DivIVA domain-containing protein [Amycolatopsis pretoriensis]|uniref:DivIVA domain-containing protein n=1 Tax=Amycolatopsis pretoriensis TaxID=218821 RepID=A0A1H5R5T7_9PSEU|nr:DivIVA domain-containing protein [Amycolatopsis pretoriensis]SEF32747.1 DivIVA domain-containing protein [Amycolatopsis pretoriensis]
MENTVSEPEAPPESDVRFPIVLRGYDRRQVDEYVRVAEKRVDRHEKARRVAERRLAKAQVPAPRSGEPDGAAGLGKRIEKILQVAKSEAAAIKEQACQEGEALRAAAEKSAAEAERARAETEHAAQREADLILSRAEEEAAAIRATHQAVLAQLSQIAAVVEEVRDRFGGEAGQESPVEAEPADSAPSLAS